MPSISVITPAMYYQFSVPRRILLYIMMLSVTSAPFALGQMVPGAQAVGESTVLGLDAAHRYSGVDINLIRSTVSGNILWPGEKAELEFSLQNKSAHPVEVTGKWILVHYRTHGLPGDVWKVVSESIDEHAIAEANVSLEPGEKKNIIVRPDIPETLGGYLLLFDAGNGHRTFATALVRCVAADPGREQFPHMTLDMRSNGSGIMLQRLGIKGARMELSAFDPDDITAPQRRIQAKKIMDEASQHNIALMITASAFSPSIQPLGTFPRPYLDEHNAMLPDMQGDMAVSPEGDAMWSRWVNWMVSQYGWPKGPLNALELWNEPWEGISISGWGADVLRYRDLYKVMAESTRAAEKVTGNQVMTGGTCSTSNAYDKLFCDGSMQFLPLFDFCSIHYQPLSTISSLDPRFLNRKTGTGPVQTWDTESWLANSDARVLPAVALMFAQGQQRAMGVFAGNVYEGQIPWSCAAAVASAAKFIGQRPFDRLLFPEGLPWVFAFGPRPGQPPEDGSLVVVGDLSDVVTRTQTRFRSVLGLQNAQHIEQLAIKLKTATPVDAQALEKEIASASYLTGASMTLKNPDREFELYDSFGNLASKEAELTIPLDTDGYLLRATQVPGAFERLVKAVQSAKIDGMQPVEIMLKDMVRPTANGAEVRVTLHNVLNRAVEGTVGISSQALGIEGARQKVTLAPHFEQNITFPVVAVKGSDENLYPVAIDADFGPDGSVHHMEQIRENVIVKRTIDVDGNLDEWNGIQPQRVTMAPRGRTQTEQAWLPFIKEETAGTTRNAKTYLAYDDQYFYFAARLADTTEAAGLPRFSSRRDDDYFYPEKVIKNDTKNSVASTLVPLDREKDVSAPKVISDAMRVPDPKDVAKRVDMAWQIDKLATSMGFDLDLKKLTRVSLYVADHDGASLDTIKVIDSNSGKLLAKTDISKMQGGALATVDLEGKVRLSIQVRGRLSVVMGLFFDSPSTPPANKTEFITEAGVPEFKTLGRLGALLPGGDFSQTESISVKMVNELLKQELTWPEGVRRYTYRKDPDLPSGCVFPAADNVQIAFNVLPPGKKPFLEFPKGTMPHFMAYADTDYEFALNSVSKDYGGGTEVWKLYVPDLPRKHFYPRQPKAQGEGAVTEAKLITKYSDGERIVECAIPWTAIPEVQSNMKDGKLIKFSCRINDNDKSCGELAVGRSVSQRNMLTFHDDFIEHWSNELEFSFAK